MTWSRQVSEAVTLFAYESEVVVDVKLEGKERICVLALNRDEHRKRLDRGLGALTSLGPLHALWSLPAESPLICDRMTPEDLETLQSLPDGYVERAEAALRRNYEPPGFVRLVGVVGRNLDRLLAQTHSIAPIVQRVAIWRRHDHPPSVSAALGVRLTRSGLGLVSIDDEGNAVILQQPAEAQPGVPAVYRWWVAEKAYESWLYAQRAQAES